MTASSLRGTISQAELAGERVITGPRRPPAALAPGAMMDLQVVPGPWKRLVFGHPARPDGTADRNAYTFCVLAQFWRHLKRREIYADASTRWRNPQARLLAGLRGRRPGSKC